MKQVIAAIIAASILFLASPRPAQAMDASAAIMMLIQYLGQQFMRSITDMTGQAIAAASANIQGEINKTTGAQIGAMAAIEDQRIQRELEEKVEDTREKLRQPVTTCAMIDTAQNLGNVTATVNATSTTQNAESTQRIFASRSVTQRVLGSYEQTRRLFCDDEMRRRGHSCDRPTVVNGDMTASYLFSSQAGNSLTHTPQQQQAVNAYINRIVAQGAPEPLQDATWEQTTQGRAYVEMTRRYTAFASLSDYSLRQVAAAHAPQQGIPGGVSKMDYLNQNVNLLFNPESLKDIADSRDPNKTLRYLAQVSAFRLAMEYDTLRSSQRTEGLLAAQLSLLGEQALLPQIQAQAGAAAAAGARRR